MLVPDAAFALAVGSLGPTIANVKRGCKIGSHTSNSAKITQATHVVTCIGHLRCPPCALVFAIKHTPRPYRQVVHLQITKARKRMNLPQLVHGPWPFLCCVRCLNGSDKERLVFFETLFQIPDACWEHVAVKRASVMLGTHKGNTTARASSAKVVRPDISPHYLGTSPAQHPEDP